MEYRYEVETNKTFQEAIEGIKNALSKRQFGVLCEVNFKDKFIEKNITFENNFVVLEVCNPFKANKILQKHLEVGYFLPCKVAIYEDNNQVKIGFIDPRSFIQSYQDEEINQVSLEVYQVLKEAVEEVK